MSDPIDPKHVCAATEAALPPELPPGDSLGRVAEDDGVVEDGEDEGEEEVEAEAEEEEEEDGEDVEVDHGLVTGPKYVNWLAEPIPNSSMLVFPTMTAPADWRGWGNGGGGGWGGRGGWQWR